MHFCEYLSSQRQRYTLKSMESSGDRKPSFTNLSNMRLFNFPTEIRIKIYSELLICSDTI